jgi:hypothetical protein
MSAWSSMSPSEAILLVRSCMQHKLAIIADGVSVDTFGSIVECTV